jgi:hypothetical protein
MVRERNRLKDGWKKWRNLKSSRNQRKYTRFIYGGGILSLEISFAAVILLILKFSPETIAWLGRINYGVLILIFLIFLITPVRQFFQKHYS